jgi:LDH2 family malate/lactate/ureidoglycolate dehydrogenase
MAGHKGYAISFMFDVLAGVLTGSSFGSAVVGPYRPTGRSGVGHLLICVDIRSMADPAEFEQRMEALIEETKATPTAPGTDEILVPGEPETRTAERLRTEGITLADDTWAALATVAAATAVPLPASLQELPA